MIKFFKILLILIFCVGLSSCAKPSSKKVQVEFWTLQLSDFSCYINSVIDEFENEHPNVDIVWVDVPFAEGEKRALASIFSNNPPDIINLNPSFAYVLASKNTLIDFNEYIDEKRDVFVNEALEINSINTKLFAIPWYLTSPVTIYNRKILKKAQIDYPAKNYNDLIEFSNKINKIDKISFMPNLAEDAMMLKILNQVNPSSIKTNKIDLLDKKNIQTYKLYHYLYNHNLIPKESITQTHRESLDKFQSGQLALIVTGGNFLKIISENSPQIYKEIEVSTQIAGENGKFNFSCMNLTIPAKSKNKKLAIDFIFHLTNSKNQLEFCKLAPILPSNKYALEDQYFKQDKTLEDKARKISSKQLENLVRPLNITKNKKEIFKIIDNSTQKIMLEEDFNVEILKQAQEDINYLLE